MKKFFIVLLITLLLFPYAVFSENVTLSPLTIRFSDGKERNGHYTGQIVNGLPHGYGVYTSVNDDGIQWHYIGHWSNGIMHGDGLMIWESGFQQNGLFSNGVFISGTTVDEIVLPDLSYLDLPYWSAGEQIAKEEILGNLVFVKVTHNYNFVNIYVDLDQYKDKKQANIDACRYILNVTEKLRMHPDIKCVQGYFQCTDSFGKTQTAIIMKVTSSKALKFDYPSMNNLIDKSIKSFANELERCEFMMGYQHALY